MLIAERGRPGVHEDMAQKGLRTVLGLADSSDDDQISECRNNEGDPPPPAPPFISSRGVGPDLSRKAEGY